MNDITVVIPTSPIKRHPSITMIQATIGLIRFQLPESKIIILADGVRKEDKERKADYRLYLVNLIDWVSKLPNIEIEMFYEHLHQTGMIKEILSQINTKFILFIEHDFPVVGDIPWAEIYNALDHVDLIRFYLEPEIVKEHTHLFSEVVRVSGLDLIKTGQWSQRPHIAKTSFYKEIAKLMPEKTYIEDGIHGYFGERFDGNPKEAWERNKLTVYYPKGDLSRCIHLDGREDEPKWALVS